METTKNKNIKFLTFLNNGCVEICKNMLKSAENVGINLDDFYIACIDKKSYDAFCHYKNCFLFCEQDLEDYQNWSFDQNSKFRQIVKYKWKVIQTVFEKEKNILWVDTDIVFRKNPISFFENKNDVLFQTGRPGSLICSGFMFFPDTEIAKGIIQECANVEGADDQFIVNAVAQKYRHGILPSTLFPNGHVYYQRKIKNKEAIIVHNNYMVGIDNKIKKFKKENLWYIKE
jgi:hypothetical protein